MKKYLQMLIMFSMLSHAQVGINTTDVHPSAILDLGINNNKALLITRVALTGTDDLITIPTPAAGLIVYNTQTTSGSNAVIGNEIYFFNGTQWKQIVDKTILDDEVEQLNTSTLGYEPIKSIDKNKYKSNQLGLLFFFNNDINFLITSKNNIIKKFDIFES